LAAFFLAFLFAAAILAFLLATGCALANPMHHPTTQINIISIGSVAGMSNSYTLGVDKSSRNKFLLSHGPRGFIQEMIEWRDARMIGTRFGGGVTYRYGHAGLVFLRPSFAGVSCHCSGASVSLGAIFPFGLPAAGAAIVIKLKSKRHLSVTAAA
jgi:hypothetical protein